MQELYDLIGCDLVELVQLDRGIIMAIDEEGKLKTGKVSAVRFSTLEAICEALDCQPGDILEYQREDKS